MTQSSNTNVSPQSAGTTSTVSSQPVKANSFTTAGIGNRGYTAADVEKILSDNKKLKEALEQTSDKLKIAQKANEEYKDANSALTKRVAAIEMERRSDKIASILSGAYKPEDLQANVERFAKSGLPIEDIASIVEPLKAARVEPQIVNNNREEEQKQHQQPKVESPTTGAKSGGCGCQHQQQQQQQQHINEANKTKSASQQYYDSKATIRNARLEDVPNYNNATAAANEQPRPEPSFLTTRNYLFNGGVD